MVKGTRSVKLGMAVLAFVAAVALAVGASALSPKEVYRKAGPGVVLIMGSDDGRSGSVGTGSIVTADGKVITNAHVVISEATKQPYKTLLVFLKPEKITGDNKEDLSKRFKVSVKAWSDAEQLDLAMLQIVDAPAGLPVVPLADPTLVEIGDKAIAIGHPETGGPWTLTTGSISTVIANFNRVPGKHVFQTEASVNRGNSGGPLLDEQGNMVGINTMISRKAADGLAITAINFSLKSSVAQQWLAQQGLTLGYAAPEQGKTALAMADTGKQPAAETKAETKPEPVKTEPVKTEPAKVEPTKVEPKPEAPVTTAKPEPKSEAKETVVAKAKPTKKPAKPVYETKKRPFKAESLVEQQMKELEEMMDWGHQHFKKREHKLDKGSKGSKGTSKSGGKFNDMGL